VTAVGSVGYCAWKGLDQKTGSGDKLHPEHVFSTCFLPDYPFRGHQAIFRAKLFRSVGWSVGIATGYGLDVPVIESRSERDFPHLSRPALRLTQPPVQWVPGLSRG
jgi:hypothetical protein